jgi:putative glutamine amidotransferase
MNTLIAVTQRVVIEARYQERRDALDQRWTMFLSACGFVAMPVPNDPAAACALVATANAGGLLLTGGNDLCVVGGDAPERDATERALIDYALERDIPVLGVCRGMQMLQHYWHVPLRRVEGHVSPEQTITVDGCRDRVNSYHGCGTTATAPELEVWATADDGVIEAVRHRTRRVVGVMWHPERFTEFRGADIALARKTFS